MVYGHANGADIEPHGRRGAALQGAWATRRSARKAACPGWRRSTAWAAARMFYEPADADLPSEHDWSTEKYLRHAPEAVRRGARRRWARTCTCCTTCTTASRRSRPGASARPRALPPVLAGRRHAGREPGGLPPDPPAHHHAAGRGRDLQHHLGLQGPDPEPADRLHPRPPWCTPAASPTCAASPTSPRCYQVRTGCHGATDLSPVCMGAALHFDLWVPNFGIQEYMRHTEETDAVFPHAYTFNDGYMHPGEAPGHGVDIDEALAAKYPYQRAYLPVNRLQHDGTLVQLVMVSMNRLNRPTAGRVAGRSGTPRLRPQCPENRHRASGHRRLHACPHGGGHRSGASPPATCAGASPACRCASPTRAMRSRRKTVCTPWRSAMPTNRASRANACR